MERVSVMASLRDGKDGALPLDLRTLGAWMRQLVFRMVAWDADARRWPPFWSLGKGVDVQKTTVSWKS